VALELYHHGSSACAAKVRFALAEKRIEWVSHYVEILKGEQFSPQFRALNPKAVVPVLVDDGNVITESTVICEYLEEAFPEPNLYPRSPLERARVRAWTKAVDEELHPACSAITYVVSHRHTILRNGAGSFEEFMRSGSGEGAAARALKWRWIQEGLEAPGAAEKIRLYGDYLLRMERALEHGQWLVGERFTMADVAMTPYVNRLAALAMEGLWLGGRLPRVADWFERVKSRPSFEPAFVKWVPAELGAEMRANGALTWPAIASLLDLAPRPRADC
jgi:glutathione S-transferase